MTHSKSLYAQALRLLFTLIKTNQSVVAPLVKEQEGGKVLIDKTYLLPNGIINAKTCFECDIPHPVEITFIPEQQVYGWFCSEAGFIVPDQESLHSYKLCYTTFFERVYTALDPQQLGSCKIKQHPPHLWYIGHLKAGEYAMQLIFAARLRTLEDYAALNALTHQCPRPDIGCVFIAEDTPSAGVNLHLGYRLISLPSLITLQEHGRLGIDQKRLFEQFPDLPDNRAISSRGRKSGLENTRAVIEYLQEWHEWPDGRNKRRDAIQKAYPILFPGSPVPANSTIENHLKRLKP